MILPSTPGAGSFVLGGTIGAGRALSVTIAGTVAPYTTQADDTTLPIAAASFAAAINAALSGINIATAWVSSGSTIAFRLLSGIAPSAGAVYTSNGGAGGTTIAPSTNTNSVDGCTICSDAHAVGSEPASVGAPNQLQRGG